MWSKLKQWWSNRTPWVFRFSLYLGPKQTKVRKQIREGLMGKRY